jgi:hypothetical protein
MEAVRAAIEPLAGGALLAAALVVLTFVAGLPAAVIALSVILILLAPVVVLMTLIFGRAYLLRPDLTVLRIRFQSSISTSLATLLIALIAANALLPRRLYAARVGFVLLVLAVLLYIAPQVRWLVAYYRREL